MYAGQKSCKKLPNALKEYIITEWSLLYINDDETEIVHNCNSTKMS